MDDIIDLLITRARELTSGLLFEYENGTTGPLKIDDSGELPNKGQDPDCPFLVCRELGGEITDPEEIVKVEVIAGLYSKAGGKAGREAIRDLKYLLARLPLTSFGDYSFERKIDWDYTVDDKDLKHHFYVRLKMQFSLESEIFSDEE